MAKGFDEEELTEEKFNEPMTINSLRARLKHIACLCWGLSCDLFSDMELSGLLEYENKQLRKRVAAFDKRVAEQEKRYERMSAAERRQAQIKRLRHAKYVAQSRHEAELARRQSNKNV